MPERSKKKIVLAVRRETLAHPWRWWPVRAYEIEVDGREFYQYRDGLCLFAIDKETGLAVAVAGSADKLGLELKRIIATNHWGTYKALLRQTLEEVNPGPRPGVVLRKKHENT